MATASEVRPGHRDYDEILDDILQDDQLDKLFPELRPVFEDAKKKPPGSVPDEPVEGPGRPRLGWPGGEVAQWGAEVLVRGLLNYLRSHDSDDFNKAYNLLDDDLKKKLTQFLDGAAVEGLFGEGEVFFNVPPSQAAKEKFIKLGKASPPSGSARGGVSVAGDDIGIKRVTDEKFTNWGETVLNTPGTTWVAPTKISQLQDIVKSAKAANKRVRAAGYRHSWSSIFSEDNQVLVSILDQDLVTKLPNTSSICATPDYSGNEFKVIQDLGAYPGNPTKGLVKVGSAVTNEDFRRWAVERDTWSIPINVIMVEITFGGSNAPICHGAGIDTKTLSDLVREIEYVDLNGDLRQLSDPEKLKAASGCFGLLGIVTSLTLEVDKMTYAKLNPQYNDLLLAIPPPPSFNLPPELQERYAALQKQPGVLEKALQDFIRTAEISYYAEWFWFPTQHDAFINAWNYTMDGEGAVDYPSRIWTFIEWLSGWAGEVVQNTLFVNLPWRLFFTPARQAWISSTIAMATLPKRQVKTQLINALHFRRGIQNMRVGDFEVEIPIPATKVNSSTRDWRLVQQAWWDGIAAMYADKNFSARIALEMRVTGHSQILLAPQFGNRLGTASIEVITSMPAVKDKNHIWKNFKQKLADKWLQYKGPDGVFLNTRPHFAKEWTDTRVRGKDWVTHLKQDSMPGQIEAFKKLLTKIGAESNPPWDLKDSQARFSTPLLDDLIFSP